jgi:preprotein translocase subunit SecA
MFWQDSAEEASDYHKAFVACALHLATPSVDTPEEELIQVGHTIEAARRAREVTQSGLGPSHPIPSLASHEPAEPKVGRNAPCPCGSGLKYKRCCMN